MLEVSDLHAYYGKSHILQGVTFNVQKGEIVSLLGRNGVGRSTTAKAIMGEVLPQGSIRFKDQEIAGKKSFEIANLGLGYVPENRDIFPTLTVRQNLQLGMKSTKAKGRWSIEEIFNMFPNLADRAEMCRTLMGDPDMIMIDEPTEGLAPKIVKQVANLLQEIANRGVAILLVEQKLNIALNISHRLYVMGHGQVVYEGTSASLKKADNVRAEWLEV